MLAKLEYTKPLVSICPEYILRALLAEAQIFVSFNISVSSNL